MRRISGMINLYQKNNDKIARKANKQHPQAEEEGRWLSQPSSRSLSLQRLEIAEREDIKNALISLYLELRVRPVKQLTAHDKERCQEDAEKLKCTHELTLIQYVKTSIDILMDLKSLEFAAEKQRCEKC